MAIRRCRGLETVAAPAGACRRSASPNALAPGSPCYALVAVLPLVSAADDAGSISADKETQAGIGIVAAVRTTGNANLTLLSTPDGRLGVGMALRY